MSTKQVQSQQGMFNQASMGQYNALQPQVGSLISNYMNNPMSVVSPYYNLATQAAVQQANVGNQARMSNLTNNMAALGTPNANLSAYQQSQINSASRANTANTANAFLQGQLGKAQAALGVQQTGLQAGLGYRPLQTGQTTTQTQTGLGTWLPQVLSGAANIGMSLFTGDASSMANMGGNFSGNSMTPIQSAGAMSGWGGGGVAPDMGWGQPSGQPSPLLNW